MPSMNPPCAESAPGAATEVEEYQWAEFNLPPDLPGPGEGTNVRLS